MDKKIIGLFGAISALALLGPVGAETAAASSLAPSLAANSFDELLQPLSNPLTILRTVDEADANAAQGQPVGGDLTLVDHHHHHNQYRRRYPHHYNQYRRRYPHHHHHHNIIRRFFGGDDR